jgi:predicted amidohydrolase
VAGGLSEGIEPGGDLPVLMLDDLAIGFAICLDFCVSGSPYSNLDVDLMFVPSFGDEKTIDGHRTTANRMRIDFATRTLVAQQAKTVVKRRRGFILSPGAELDKATPENCASNKAWTTFCQTSVGSGDK